MNQIKYLVYALLLFFLFLLVATTISKLSSTKIISPRPTIINFEPATITPVTVSSEGKTIFQSNCQTCHALDKTLTGPALRGVEERGPWTDRKNLIRWVKNSAVTINKFQYTKNLMEQFGGQIMPSFPQLTDKQIEDIFNYIKQVPAYTPMPMASN